MQQYSTKTPEGVALKSWSISRLKVKCPYRLKLAYIDRVRPKAVANPPAISPWEQPIKRSGSDEFLAQQPATQPVTSSRSPVTVGTVTEAPHDRGIRIHKAAELYVSGERACRAPELDKFAQEFAVLRAAYPQGNVFVERQLGFDRQWKTMSAREPSTWLRVGPDIYALSADRTEAALIDLKTGRKEGNEVEHMDQVTLGAVAIFEKYQLLERVTAEVWYLDSGAILKRTFTRGQAARFRTTYDRRGTDFTAERTEWPQEPNRQNCSFCPFKTGKLGGPRSKLDKCGMGFCDANGDEY